MSRYLGLNMDNKLKANNIVYICVTIIVCFVIFSFTHYKIKDRELMSQNIEKAITKDVDPLAVRCSYAPNDDIICITHSFAPTGKK